MIFEVNKWVEMSFPKLGTVLGGETEVAAGFGF